MAFLITLIFASLVLKEENYDSGCCKVISLRKAQKVAFDKIAYK
jgi:hypothetical protein